MTLPVPSGGRSGLRFALFGFPVRIDISFVVVMAMLGFTGDATFSHVVLWVLIGAVSVLAHELGHAFVARTTGARPTIDLHSFGGLTRYVPAGPVSRLRSLSIAVAGPLVGIVIGLVLLTTVARGSLAVGSATAYVVNAAVFVNLGWGLLNLLPVLPLDGGHALAELLPGDQQSRLRRAAMVSVPVAAAVAILALKYQYVFGAIIAGWFAVDNVRTLAATGRSAQAPDLPPPAPMTAADRDALWLVDQGRPEQAKHLLETLPPGTSVDVSVRGLVLAANGRAELGRPLVRHAFAQAPDDPLRAGVLARLLAGERDWSGLLALLASGSGAHVPVEVVASAQQVALGAGAAQAAAALGEAVLPRSGELSPGIARRTALAWVRAGDPDRAARLLAAARDRGWIDADTVARDLDALGGSGGYAGRPDAVRDPAPEA